MKAFTSAPSVERVLAQGETKSSVIVARGLQIDLRVVPPESWGAAMVYFTGSKEHNVRLRGHALKKKLLLNEYGLYKVGAEARGQEIASKTEEEVYAALSLPCIPPELREDRRDRGGPRGRFLRSRLTRHPGRSPHAYTRSDGRDTLAAMARRAKDKGYAYMAVTDHSPGLGLTMGLNPERIAVRVAEAKAFNVVFAPFRILVGTEVDIRANGTLDYPDEVLRGFDVVSASVHSAFGQSRDVITKRIIDAMRNPYVTAFSHPTGRLLERRDPYAVDLAAIIAAAKETGTWLEVNGGPQRLDLPDIWVRKAIEAGVYLVTNSTRTPSRNSIGWSTRSRTRGVAGARRRPSRTLCRSTRCSRRERRVRREAGDRETRAIRGARPRSSRQLPRRGRPRGERAADLRPGVEPRGRRGRLAAEGDDTALADLARWLRQEDSSRRSRPSSGPIWPATAATATSPSPTGPLAETRVPRAPPAAVPSVRRVGEVRLKGAVPRRECPEFGAVELACLARDCPFDHEVAADCADAVSPFDGATPAFKISDYVGLELRRNRDLDVEGVLAFHRNPHAQYLRKSYPSTLAQSALLPAGRLQPAG